MLVEGRDVFLFTSRRLIHWDNNDNAPSQLAQVIALPRSQRFTCISQISSEGGVIAGVCDRVSPDAYRAILNATSADLKASHVAVVAIPEKLPGFYEFASLERLTDSRVLAADTSGNLRLFDLSKRKSAAISVPEGIGYCTRLFFWKQVGLVLAFYYGRVLGIDGATNAVVFDIENDLLQSNIVISVDGRQLQLYSIGMVSGQGTNVNVLELHPGDWRGNKLPHIESQACYHLSDYVACFRKVRASASDVLVGVVRDRGLDIRIGTVRDTVNASELGSPPSKWMFVPGDASESDGTVSAAWYDPMGHRAFLWVQSP